MYAKRVHVIACGVLSLDLREAARETGIDVSLEFLPGGLHSEPRELKRRLQAAIDSASERSLGDLIAIGYGVCGLGTAGLFARQVPLAIPRVHDCIALFLGSDAAYRREFAACPGTYYVSAGWVEERSRPLGEGEPRRTPAAGPESADFDELVGKYGSENAESIRYFFSSWERNYRRAAFIDTGNDEASRRHAELARSMAGEFGWRYEELKGTRDLLRRLLKDRMSSDEILIVPPHHVTVFDPLSRGLAAAPVWESAPPAEAAAVDGGAVERGGAAAGLATPARAATARPDVRVGLGIDAGGTYTDAVIYDFDAGRVVQASKALTTKWDHAIGIRGALDGLDPAHLRDVRLVALSTTLATNAIVEGQGQKVGLLLMPPYGRFDAERFSHSPIALIDGRLEIDGAELQPVDPEQVRRLVRDMVAEGRVGAFAVTGYASHANPAHELQVKAIVREVSGLHVTCGHDISEGLNYRIRAETAALNARIMPYLEALLDRVRAALAGHGVDAPVMVVRSDGTLMSLETARERPIETILSGPAASAEGGRHLAGVDDAIVVDMGGTTTDTAMLRGGHVRTCEDGATVGRWKTHVRALDVRTVGLGGDSRVTLERGSLLIGPQRVAPVAWLAARHPGTAAALAWIERHVDAFDISTRGMDLVMLNGTGEGTSLTADERAVIDALRDGPLTLRQLAEWTGAVSWQFLALDHLEAGHVVQRCTLTPTDLLHASEQLTLWDADAAKRMTAVFARLANLAPEALCERVARQIVRSLAIELLKKELDELPASGLPDVAAEAAALVDRALAGRGAPLSVSLSLARPVVGIGAPAHFYLPAAAEILGARHVVPPNAAVANAVGAITGRVSIGRQARIGVNDMGRYAVEGLPGVPSFARFEDANRHAVEALTERVRAAAREAGTDETAVEILVRDQVGDLADGSRLFLGRTVEARITGRPDVRRPARVS